MKALVLASGGLDSSTAIALAIEKHGKENVIALSLFYGQKHDKEIEAAKAVAAYYGIEQLFLDLTKIFEFSSSSLLKGAEDEIPHTSYGEQRENGEIPTTYVPFRNGLFLATAASIAQSKGCEILYYGAHADDASGAAYPDCTKEFNSAINEAIWLGTGKELKVEGPFVNMTKADIVKEGLRLGVPYHLTWSCYEGGDHPCGQCGTCIDRSEAFAKNGIKDPAL